MLARTHLAFGFLTAMIAKNMIPVGNVYIFFGLVLFGALLPDIDSPNSIIAKKLFLLKPFTIFTKHRGILHSLIGTLALSGIVFFLISKTYGFALFLGYFSHLLIDGLTLEGINFLHPVSKLHLSGFVETGKWLEHVILIGLVLIILLKLF